MKNAVFAAAFAAGSLIAAGANATTISFYDYTEAAYQAATAGAVVEDFESFGTANANENWNALTSTQVGTFDSIGGTGSGSTCAANGGNCTTLALQYTPINAQGNIVPTDGHRALNSNDTLGLIWNVGLSDNSAFDGVVFAVRDAADISGTIFKVVVDGVEESFTAQANGNLKYFAIDFGASVTSAIVTMHTAVNDAFTIDGAAILPTPSAVPLPATGLLLLAGLGALGAVRKRKTA